MQIKKFTPDTPVKDLPGVGEKRNEQLNKLGIFTLRDLIFYFPRSYENRGDVHRLGDIAKQDNLSSLGNKAFILTVATEVKTARIRRGMEISKFRAFDESGSCEIVFFNSPFVRDIFHVGGVFRFYGKLAFSKSGKLSLGSPKYEPIIEGHELDDFIPIYPLTQGLTSKMIDKFIKAAIDDVLPYLEDPLPDKLRIEENLCTLTYALKNMHFPEDADAMKKSVKRLAFDEMLLFGLNVSITAEKRTLNEGVPFSPCSMNPLLELLPYELTNSQKNAINDIYFDTVLKKKDGKTPAMSRILVGDVGSGKTICAACAMYLSAKSGYQSALMVPTEILAYQHYQDMKELFSKLDITVELLTGSTRAAKKREIYSKLENGEIDIIIGTHAIITDKVQFSKLGLIITDEQHRFGVGQRAVLKNKEQKAHMLVMSATPIPRTLALALYGDLDTSRITELPKGRMRVDTFVVDESYRQRLNNFIRKQVQEGGQCYIVCPAIEHTDDDDVGVSREEILGGFGEYKQEPLKSAVEYAEELQKKLKDIKIECLHGKMKNTQKDEIMSRFSSGETQVLVSTTVIEVGVNVPNACLMIVENAERFGLSQLHQLRGRVGRGKRKSYCVLVSNSKNEISRSRLEVMRTTYDGYEIADKDLMLRGPGDFFSSNSNENFRQSGGFEFKLASMVDDKNLFNEAFSAAKRIAKDDPDLILPENKLLKEEVMRAITPPSTIS